MYFHRQQNMTNSRARTFPSAGEKLIPHAPYACKQDPLHVTVNPQRSYRVVPGAPYAHCLPAAQLRFCCPWLLTPSPVAQLGFAKTLVGHSSFSALHHVDFGILQSTPRWQGGLEKQKRNARRKTSELEWEHDHSVAGRSLKGEIQRAAQEPLSHRPPCRQCVESQGLRHDHLACGRCDLCYHHVRKVTAVLVTVVLKNFALETAV